MLLNFNMNFMEMSLNGFLWLDLNSVFLFSNLHLKMATITQTYLRNDTQIRQCFKGNSEKLQA